MSPSGRDRAAKRITIVLADDHAVVRGALKALLDGQDDLEVVGEAGDLESARGCHPRLAARRAGPRRQPARRARVSTRWRACARNRRDRRSCC